MRTDRPLGLAGEPDRVKVVEWGETVGAESDWDLGEDGGGETDKTNQADRRAYGHETSTAGRNGRRRDGGGGGAHLINKLISKALFTKHSTRETNSLRQRQLNAFKFKQRR